MGMQLRILISLVLVGLFPASSPARTFTSTDGRTMEAELIKVEGKHATLKRDADRQVFELEISLLSLDDQLYIKQWLAEKHAVGKPLTPHPLGYQTVRIHLPSIMDLAEFPMTLGSPCSPRRIGPRSVEMELPVGGCFWMEMMRYQTNYQSSSFLIRFDGSGSDYYYDWGEGVLKVGLAPNAEKRACGVSLRSDLNRKVDRDAIHLLHQSNPLKSIAVSGQLGDGSAFQDIDPEVATLSMDEAPTFLLPQTLRGLRLKGDADPGFLASVPKLEALALLERDLEIDSPFIRGLLLNLPALQALHLDARYTPDLFPEFGKSRTLKNLHVGGRHGAYRDWPGLGGLDQLESLYTEVAIQATAIAANANLALLQTDSTGLVNPDGRTIPFPKFRSLELHSTTDVEALAKVKDQAPFAAVRFVASMQEPDFSKLSGVEHVQLGRPSSSTAPSVNLHILEPVAHQLKTLELRYVDQAGIQFLADHCPKLEALTIADGRFQDLSVLSSLDRLVYLRLNEMESLESIDLAKLPALQGLEIDDAPVLKTVAGIGSHPKLTDLRLEDCQALLGLGEDASNQKLETLVLVDCESLEDIKGLRGCESLTNIHLEYCPNVGEDLGFRPVRNPRHLEIRGFGSVPYTYSYRPEL